MRVEYSDGELIALYGEWSEDNYAASFLTCSPSHAAAFVRWLRQKEALRAAEGLAYYERSMLDMVRPLLAAN